MTFLIERTGARVSCLLNPESLEARRSAGLARRRLAGGGMLGNPRGDDPLVPTGGGVTEYDLQLLFDVAVANEGRLVSPRPAPSEVTPTDIIPSEVAPAERAGMDALEDIGTGGPVDDPAPDEVPLPAATPEPPVIEQPVPAAPVPAAPVPAAPVLATAVDPALVTDVRTLTQPLWALAETGEPVDGALVPPRVRFIWGKSWNVPGVVLAVAERLEMFDANGVPRRSWLSLRLRRVAEAPAADSAAPPRQPVTPQFGIDRPEQGSDDAGFDTVTPPVDGDGFALVRHDQIGAEQYGDPTMGRVVFDFNDIDDLLRLAEGTRLRLPPRETLAAAG